MAQPPTQPTTSASFLDVDLMLEQSQPRARVPKSLVLVAVVVVVILAQSYIASRMQQAQGLAELLSAVVIGALLGLGIFLSWSAARAQRAEQMRLEAVEELIQLRRWSDAAGTLRELLSRPMRSPHARIQALIYLAMVLARYHRFEDTIAVQNYILEHVTMDDRTTHGLRLGRAMAMLREDHLFDADRAISELRHSPSGSDSGGTALVELYRDVKTGHPAEAIAIFNDRLPVMRDQLGFRLADAYALVARAHDLLGQDAEARSACENATLLSTPVELQRRYPEVASVLAKYPPAPTPPELRQMEAVA